MNVAHIPKVHEQNNSILTLMERLMSVHKEFFKKHSPKSNMEYWARDGKFGVSFQYEEICISNEKGTIAQMDFGNDGWGSCISPLVWEFDATNVDDCFNIWLAYDNTNNGEDVMIMYNPSTRTIQFDDNYMEFVTGKDYDFKTKADKEEILFKINLEYSNCISFDMLKADLDRITDFRKRKLPKGAMVQIWSYDFPLNIHDLLGDI